MNTQAKIEMYFAGNQIVGVSILSEDTALARCDATRLWEDTRECQIIDRDGNEWEADLGVEALEYWFNVA